MNIFLKRNKRTRTPNLVPLINIVFLLLIFFMLTGTLKRYDIFDISPPQSTTGADAEAPELVILISKSNQIALNNKNIEFSELQKQLLVIVETYPLQEVLVKADGKAYSGTLSKIINIIRESGIKRAAIVTKTIDASN
ncbi:MAG: hypothetical protein CFH32_00515 [Alphaproteobacteria bacterium MarineAlpha9_Bin2]|nr:MAG: hypothetical protein CFH32_00515 [Alphaproteobacteria bacterium MarineAlpha9_Bin2]